MIGVGGVLVPGEGEDGDGVRGMVCKVGRLAEDICW